MVDVAKAEFAAIAEAKKAGNPGLRKAGGATDLGSGLPLDDPLYRNPADVAFNAVLDWCRANG
jgi:hypothetical protein